MNFKFPDNFAFGVANAATQVEDGLSGAWEKWGHKGRIPGFNESAFATKKISFWSHPETEISLAQELGAEIFRMSLDWERLVPSYEMAKNHQIEEKAFGHYEKIIDTILGHKMQIMLTLFHHSLPEWAIKMNGWKNPEVADYFVHFANTIITRLHSKINSWSIFNEANVFALFTYGLGLWPHHKRCYFDLIKCFKFKGGFYLAQENMARAHNEIYQNMHQKFPAIKIGVAHNIANYQGQDIFGKIMQKWSDKYLNHYFLQLTKGRLDFLGINYYGKECLNFTGLYFDKKSAYNDAGRGIDPTGLFLWCKKLYEQYQCPLYITENGTADEDDFIRSAYLYEHLIVIQSLLEHNIPVEGYLIWTLTDNFEWSDGYGPKFGLVKYDRYQQKHIKRPSYFNIKKIFLSKTINENDRESIWYDYWKKLPYIQKMYRAKNAKNALAHPRTFMANPIDWRFNANSPDAAKIFHAN